MYKGLDKRKHIELKNAVCKLDFIDFEKACDLLANSLDFLAFVYQKMPDAIKYYTPTYEYTRALYSDFLNNEETSTIFKYTILEYLKDFYYKNKVKDGLTEKIQKSNIIKFKK